MQHTKSYVKNHPNPQLYREDYLLLNGEWDFAFDDKNIGLENQWFINFPSNSRKIIVPYAYQCEASGINEPTHQCDVIWYHKKINLTKLSPVMNLIFNGVDFECEVFINGQLIGSHFGGYDIFKYNIFNYINIGENDITLRIVDKMNIDQIRGKQRWRKESFECFYTETSGIWKDVYIEYLNENHIDNFKFDCSYKNKNIRLTYEANIRFNLKLNVQISFKNEILIDKDFDAKSSDELLIQLNNVQGWSSSNPNLYDVILTLKNQDEILDKIYTYLGFIDVEAKGNRIYLNGVDTYLKLILDQGYYPNGFYTGNEDQFIKDITLMKEMGFNGCRKHEKIETPLFNYYCDILGYYMWQELPSAHKYSYNYTTTAYKEITRQIKDHYNHPSIISYVIYNESWGVNEILNLDCEIKDSNDLYHYVKSLVPNKFVISNDGWEHTTSDLITFHNYKESYDELYSLYKDSFEKIKEGKNAPANNERMLFAKGFKYSGQPLLLDEFCGLAFTKDESIGWGYNFIKDEKDYIEKITKQVEAIRDLKEIRGYCFTQLSDVESEVNGLVDFNRNLKVKIEDIKRINSLCK